MKESGSLLFPFQWDNENECLLRAFTVEDTVLSAIKCFLLTRKGSRLGTNMGSFLPELLFQNIQDKQLPVFSGELKSELEKQFTSVTFLDVVLSKTLTDNVSNLNVSIKLMVPTNPNILDLNLSLPSVFNN